MRLKNIKDINTCAYTMPMRISYEGYGECVREPTENPIEGGGIVVLFCVGQQRIECRLNVGMETLRAVQREHARS